MGLSRSLPSGGGSASLICSLFLFSLTTAHSVDVPSSARSRSVIARVAPKLNQEFAQKNLNWGSPIFIRIIKESKELELWAKSGKKFELFRNCRIHFYSGTLGPRLREGDRQAPEGFYYVPGWRMNPRSRFHLPFDLGYPNTYDRQHRRTGSLLMVHGSTVSIGCFAMTEARIEEIHTLADAALNGGQSFFRVHSFPFRMTSQNMLRHYGSKWNSFWRNLKQGYDFFERSKNPPNVEVKNRSYVFESAIDRLGAVARSRNPDWAASCVRSTGIAGRTGVSPIWPKSLHPHHLHPLQCHPDDGCS
tara:strand:- start:2458 stop:3369 length:912 start_codon:yes stop_codon:yes gene_type:complete